MKGKSSGFTLVELLAILAAIVLLVAVGIAVFYALDNRMNQAAMVSTVANGANIYQSYFANQMDSVAMGDEMAAWPKMGQFQTSTEFFIHMVTGGIMCVSYDFFSARGIPSAKSMDAADFKAENNAWRLVLDLDEAPEGTPFLFTRNYDPDRRVGPDGKIQLSGEPFGSKGLVVVMKGGAAFMLKGKQLNMGNFNPSGAVLTVVGP